MITLLGASQVRYVDEMIFFVFVELKVDGRTTNIVNRFLPYRFSIVFD